MLTRILPGIATRSLVLQAPLEAAGHSVGTSHCNMSSFSARKAQALEELADHPPPPVQKTSLFHHVACVMIYHECTLPQLIILGRDSCSLLKSPQTAAFSSSFLFDLNALFEPLACART